MVSWMQDTTKNTKMVFMHFAAIRVVDIVRLVIAFMVNTFFPSLPALPFCFIRHVGSTLYETDSFNSFLIPVVVRHFQNTAQIPNVVPPIRPAIRNHIYDQLSMFIIIYYVCK